MTWKKAKIWVVAYLLWPAATLVVYGAWRAHYVAGIAAIVVALHFLVSKPFARLGEALNQAEYREWALGLSWLALQGWANTLGDQGREAALSTSRPYISRDLGNRNDHWWYRPDGAPKGDGGEWSRAEEQATADFTKMTMMKVYRDNTFAFDLRWNNSDPFEPQFETKMISRSLNGGPIEFMSPEEEWQVGRVPWGLEVAYRVHLRATRRERVTSPCLTET